MPQSRKSLTDRQQRFASEYTASGNGTKAALAAGYAPSGAHVEASRMLKNPKVAARVAELQNAAAVRNEITVDKIVALLMNSYKDAKAANQHGPATRCLELVGKTVGAFTDRLALSPADEQDDAALIERLARGDRAATAVLTRLIGKPRFDA